MTTVTIKPGAMVLADWADIWRGATIRIDAGARADVDAAAATVDRLIASGKAVYGLNTGFGKLAQTRIADDELATLQERLVLSHAAGIGDPLDTRIAASRYSTLHAWL